MITNNVLDLNSEMQEFVAAISRGIGQIAFVDTVSGGLLVIASIACISLPAAAMALVGATLATCLHRFLNVYSRPDWLVGLSAYNSGIVGIFWGGFLASESVHLLIFFPLSLFCCLIFEIVFRKLSARLLLPVLSLPAVLVGWITAAAFAGNGLNFWVMSSTGKNEDYFLIPCILLILTAMIMASRAAAIQAALLAGIAALAVSWYSGMDLVALAGLWGLTVVAASFGIEAVFFKGTTAAGEAALVAALISAVLWLIWTMSPLNQLILPLLMPFILGTWVTLLIARKVDLGLLSEPIRTWKAFAGRAFY